MGENVIYSYTDDMALDDGVLIDTTGCMVECNGKPVNRITARVYALFSKDDPYAVLPFPVLAEFMKRAVESAKLDETGDGFLLTTLNGLWLVANEVGGYTLMKPEDY